MSWYWYFLVVMMGIAVSVVYRYTVLSFYRAYPKDPHFYQNKTYQRSYHHLFCSALFFLYILVYIIFAYLSIIPNIGIKHYIALPFAFFLTIIACVDCKLYLIPFWCLVGVLIIGGLYHLGQVLFIDTEVSLIDLMYIGFQEKIPFFIGIGVLYWLVLRNRIGLGDIYFLMILLILFSVEVWLYAVLLACLLGILFACILKIVKKSIGYIAFGPWIALSTWLMFLVVLDGKI
ncbi:prepilin peptidase [Pelistega ratti]|uniref:prepilin peptidase n=1 Tax=Pelistega ratti TaxID=2652177 RepID=UPI0013588EA7|nr:prepilin peptidase [Pelistega ratti]